MKRSFYLKNNNEDDNILILQTTENLQINNEFEPCRMPKDRPVLKLFRRML